MKLWLLSARPDTASNRRLVEAAAGLGAALEVLDGTALVAASAGVPVDAGDARFDRLPDVVLARVGNWRPESLLALCESLTERGVATPNPPRAIRVGRDHWRTAQTLAAAGLPMPVTLAGADPEVLARAAARRLRFPVVVKQRRSRMGVGVVRCVGRDHLEAVLDSLWRVGDEVVVQEYVPTGGASLRLLVVGSEVVAAARFQARGEEWRSNAARGGTAEAADPDDRAVEIAIAATKATGLGICGVDLLPGRDRVVVGEVNPTPGFIGLEKATGVDVASAVIGHMLSLVG